MANGIDFGTAVGLIKGLGSPDPAVIESAVDGWLDDHPEATTTVQDGSITKAKLDSNLQGTVDDVADLKSAVEEISQSGIDASGASDGQVPVADGEGSWEWDDPAGGVSDVQINGTSILDAQGVANVPIAGLGDITKPGVVKINPGWGIGYVTSDLDSPYYGALVIQSAGDGLIKAGTNSSYCVTSVGAKATAFYGLAKAAGDTTQSASSNAVGNYTDNAKSAIHEMLNGSVAVTGTTPSITALPGIRYVCGEVATLDITLPASGIVDVVFESGSTATVLTITPPTGMTLKWANGFDPTALDANTVYEINIADGLGVAASWT